MVIDKTTGKGCALRIAAKTITQNLIADGIVGNIIAKKNRYQRDVWLRVIDHGEGRIHVSLEFTHGQAEAPIWVPSFIDKGIWTRAAGKFTVDGRLDVNVAEFLLPEMDAYLQSIPDSELVSMTRDFLMEHGVLNQPIRQHKGNVYYFDQNEIYAFDQGSKLFPYRKGIRTVFTIKGPDSAFFNSAVWIKAATQFEVGMTLKECVGIFVKTELTHGAPQKPSPLEQLIQYIAPPAYERVPGNDNINTFDRIRVTVGLPRYQFHSWGALQNEVKKYQGEIYRRVVQKLEADRQFKRYGVPVGFLKLSNVTLLPDFSLEFIFELKERG